MANESQNNKVLDLIRESYPNYHPLVSIAHIAHDAEGDKRLELECHKTIAKYVESELKSVEVKGHIDHEINTLRVIVDNRQPALIEGTAVEDVQDLVPISFESMAPQRAEEPESVRKDREIS